MSVAKEINRTLSAREVAEHYGIHPNRSGYIQCFKHEEKTPSLMLYKEPGRGFYCFGCSASGSVIDFVMQIYGIGFQQAIVRISHDFNLNLIGETPVPAARRVDFEKRAQMRKQRDEYEKNTVLYRYYLWARDNLTPTGPDEPIHPDYAQSFRELLFLDHYFDHHNYDRAWDSL